MINSSDHKVDVLPLLSKIAGFIFETENPLSHAQEIVRQTAKSQQADISTLFLVEQNRLTLKGGVAFLEEEEISLPTDILGYELEWSVASTNHISKMGLTAYVAVTNQKLSINSLEELEAEPAHTARWDEHLYPHGRDDDETGFGCLYAVPISRSEHGSPKDCVLGVFKIERRKNKQPFTDSDKSIFDLVAAHLSLLLQTFYRAQNRVFSDVAHAIGGGLGRSYASLTMCEEVIKNKDKNIDDAFKILQQALPGSVEMLARAMQRLDAVLNVARDPAKKIEKTFDQLCVSVISEVELKTGNENLNVKKCIEYPLKLHNVIQLTSLQYHDLSSMLGNLLDNAVRHSRSKNPPRLIISLSKKNYGNRLIFEVADCGIGIRQETLDILRENSGEYQLPGMYESRSTGLRRVFGLVKLNNWFDEIINTNGTSFKIFTPDFRTSANKEI